MATTYQTIYQYVLDDVKRPDLEEIIKRRIQRAVMYFHRKDMWKRDLVEQIYEFSDAATLTTTPKGGNTLFLTNMNNPSNPLFVQRINLAAFPGLRFIQYVRKWQANRLDPDSGALGTFADGDFLERAPDKMFDGYGADVNNVFYRSGEWLHIKSSTPLTKMAIGWFTDPTIEPVENMCSWIADNYPGLISARVKAVLFSDIGKDEEKKSAKFEEAEELANLYANNVRTAMA